MIVQHGYEYVHIGLLIRALRSTGVSSTKSHVLDELEKLQHNLLRNNFQVTLAAIDAQSFSRMNRGLAALASDGEMIGPTLAAQVAQEMHRVEEVVYAEARTKQIYILPNRRFNSEFLLNAPYKLFSFGVFFKLEEIARQDISSACRCILFGEATAAAFHILRATESVLKSYYFKHKKTKRLAKPMWGSMVNELRSKSKNKPPESLLTSLDVIRTAYRNPTQHPEAIYDIDGVQDLFGVCLDVIGKMGHEL